METETELETTPRGVGVHLTALFLVAALTLGLMFLANLA
jgi:hypothetical protein